MSMPEYISAIDLGSNGIRFVVAAREGNQIVEVESTREGVRLGQDAFERGELSDASLEAAAAAFERFAARLTDYPSCVVQAVATSAARTSSNKAALVELIRDRSGIDLQIIDPLEEARLVAIAVAGEVDMKGQTALLVDMGGGSVEVTVVADGLVVGFESLRLGPVRLLGQLAEAGKSERDAEELFDRYRGSVAALLRSELDYRTPDLCIGTGGNIECLGKKLRRDLLMKDKTGRITRSDLNEYVPRLLAIPPAERMVMFALRPDRADVIALAAMVLRMIVNEAGVSRMEVPGVGLKEGLLREIARREWPEVAGAIDLIEVRESS